MPDKEYSEEELLHFMKAALEEARLANEEDEVPVGAVVVSHGQIIARGHNMSERLNDATAHAEMIAITAASENLGSKYLKDCTLFVTLEPCTMCASASAWAQLGGLVYGASDEKKGFHCLGSKKVLHPKTTVKKGILEKESQELLEKFFKSKR